MFMRYSIALLYIFITWNAYRLIDESTASYVFVLSKIDSLFEIHNAFPAAMLTRAYLCLVETQYVLTNILMNIFPFLIHSLLSLSNNLSNSFLHKSDLLESIYK